MPVKAFAPLRATLEFPVIERHGSSRFSAACQGNVAATGEGEFTGEEVVTAEDEVAGTAVGDIACRAGDGLRRG